MNTASNATEQRLRRALRLAATAVFSASPVELFLTEHTQSPIQLFPFVASVLGLVAVWGLVGQGLRARAGSVVLVLVALVGVLGVWEHVEHNFAFEREIQPSLTASAAAWKALFGASPALAPGILVLGAGLAWAARRR